MQHHLCVATDQRVAEYSESASLNTLHILGCIGPGEHNVARAIEFIGRLVQAQGQDVTRQRCLANQVVAAELLLIYFDIDRFVELFGFS